MADTFTSRLRLQQPTVGADSNTWGGILNTDWQLVDDAAQGVATIDLTGLTTYTLTSNNGSADQARMAFYLFTGALTANCTVTIPDIDRVGWAANQTTGGYNVILTNGKSTSLTLQTGVGGSTPAQTFYSASASGVYDPMFGKLTTTNPGSLRLPGGLIFNYGSGATDATGGKSISYNAPFKTTTLCALAVTAADAGGSSGDWCSVGNQTANTFIQVIARAPDGSLNKGGIAFYFFAIGI